ncbi:MAG TPA: HAMP domain-containing sensor histidine kinase [Bacteroidota bacterium]|nr:HAMP domain-containing sensor histidine kinase [Bacteroidota bacterium]
MRNPFSAIPHGQAGNFKIALLIFASLFVLGVLFYSQRITNQLLARERQVVDLYAKSYEYVSSDRSSSGDYSFLFNEVWRTIDFPVVLTDTANYPLYWRNIPLDSTLTQEQQRSLVAPLVPLMDKQNKPIKIAPYDTVVLNYVHYGESALIGQLRWLPVLEIVLAAVFILVAYVGFSYIKRTEQSNIWVGMAKETAHQLGTPLSSMIGWLERAKTEGAAAPGVVESLQEMANDVERLNKVAARFSKIGSKPDLKEENLTEVIEGVIDYIARRIPRSGKKVDLRVETPGEYRARINRELFEWVIENLMKNALDAMDGQTGRITFRLSQSSGRTTIDVSDTGKGIDPKFHKEVFRPGYSTKKRGWGLGLSLSKRIIEEYHKGKLFVKQSAPGSGTTFRIRLG